MKILHVCQRYETSVRRMVDVCASQLNAGSAVLQIHEGYNNFRPFGDGGAGPFYSIIEEEYFDPDVILAYGDTDEAFIIEPKCPIIRMDEKYAGAFWHLPDTSKFERKFPLNPSACKVMYQQPELNRDENEPARSADVFDVWVFVNFDAYDISCCMAWGCIPVVPAGIGAEDWIAHGLTGLLYHNDIELSILVEELKMDPMLRRDISSTARQWVYEHADIGILEDLLERIRGNKCQ